MFSLNAPSVRDGLFEISSQELQVSATKDTPVTFSREHTEKIREMLAAPETEMTCPRCGEKLTVSGPVSGVGNRSPVYHVSCLPCRRHAAISDLKQD